MLPKRNDIKFLHLISQKDEELENENIFSFFSFFLSLQVNVVSRCNEKGESFDYKLNLTGA